MVVARIEMKTTKNVLLFARLSSGHYAFWSAETLLTAKNVETHAVLKRLRLSMTALDTRSFFVSARTSTKSVFTLGASVPKYFTSS